MQLHYFAGEEFLGQVTEQVADSEKLALKLLAILRKREEDKQKS